MIESGVSPLPREARPYQGRRAGLVTRMIAAALDGVVVILVLIVGYVSLAGFLFLVDPRGFSFPDIGLLFCLASVFGVLVVYQTLAWRLTGRTYGGRVMGLRIVNHRGRRLRWGGAFVRALFSAGFPIGLMWVAVSRENRSVQDVLLRTSVVYDWQPNGGSLRLPG
jgi:uncharacterized RDD family membrane protein YckC